MAIKFKSKKKKIEQENKELLELINEKIVNSCPYESRFEDLGYDKENKKSLFDWLVHDKSVGILSEETGGDYLRLKLTYNKDSVTTLVARENVDNFDEVFYELILNLMTS